jgi:hypothetical protein
MRTSTPALLLLSLLRPGCDGDAISKAAAAIPASSDPVVVELFTSEGCSSCPRADERLSVIDHDGLGGVPVIVLAMHVDYWDELGWKDTFGSPLWSARQAVYSHSLARGGFYTPEAVVDGSEDFVGSDDIAARHAIQRAAARQKATVTLSRAGSATTADEIALTVGVSHLPAPTPGDSIDVVTAVTEDHIMDPVTRGENAGRTLALAPVVLSLNSIGPAVEGASSAQTVHLPPNSGARALRVVAFLQERASRRVVGAASLRLSSL